MGGVLKRFDAATGTWRPVGVPSAHTHDVEYSPMVHEHSADDITSGTLDVARIPNLDAAKITSGEFAIARIPLITVPNGGTGRTTLTAGSYLQGNGTAAVNFVTPANVLTDIGAAPLAHDHSGLLDPTPRTFGDFLTVNVQVPSGNRFFQWVDSDTARETYMGAAAASHNHSAANITSGTLALARIPTITVANGGTGATTAAAARSNLDVFSRSETAWELIASGNVSGVSVALPIFGSGWSIIKIYFRGSISASGWLGFRAYDGTTLLSTTNYLSSCTRITASGGRADDHETGQSWGHIAHWATVTGNQAEVTFRQTDSGGGAWTAWDATGTRISSTATAHVSSLSNGRWGGGSIDFRRIAIYAPLLGGGWGDVDTDYWITGLRT